MATTIANNILLKSYGAQSEYGPDIPLSAFVVIIKLFQIILNIACGITAGALPIMGLLHVDVQRWRLLLFLPFQPHL